MDEMREDMSRFIKAFFLKCLVSVGVSDHSTNDDGDILLFELFLFSVALSGIVPLKLTVEALAASL
jgi:hypothetical protein